jgi:hypothetical protein
MRNEWAPISLDSAFPISHFPTFVIPHSSFASSRSLTLNWFIAVANPR